MERVQEVQPLAKDAAMAFAGALAFGVAAASGHGVRAMARGAWAGPALFVGGALLALPPLYMLSALGGDGEPAEAIASRVAKASGRVGLALLGLAAPAAFFSTTMRGDVSFALLLATSMLVGAAGITAIARRGAPLPSVGATLAALAWPVFAIALGARLMFAIAQHVLGSS